MPRYFFIPVYPDQQIRCALSPIDFVAFARACGANGFRCTQSDEVRPAIAAMLASPGAALLEAVVDANEPPLKPNQLKG